jgi:hypothetical protein
MIGRSITLAANTATLLITAGDRGGQLFLASDPNTATFYIGGADVDGTNATGAEIHDYLHTIKPSPLLLELAPNEAVYAYSNGTPLVRIILSGPAEQ